MQKLQSQSMSDIEKYHCSACLRTYSYKLVCDNDCGSFHYPCCQTCFYRNKKGEIIQGHNPSCGIYGEENGYAKYDLVERLFK